MNGAGRGRVSVETRFSLRQGKFGLAEHTLLLALLTLTLSGCTIQGRFYAERRALEALPSVWVQIEDPDSLVKGTVGEAQVHTGGHTLIYNVEVVSESDREAVYQREIPSRLPWDPSISEGSEHPDDITVLFKIPEGTEGQAKLLFRISYVWAHVVGASAGTMTYDNTPRTDEVEVTVHISDS